MPDFKPHAACQPRATATVAKPRLPTSRRSYFLRVSVGRSYSGKLIHEETFRVQAQLAATRTLSLSLTLTLTLTLPHPNLTPNPNPNPNPNPRWGAYES